MALTFTTRNTERGDSRLRLPRLVRATIVARQEMGGIDRSARRRWARQLRALIPHRWHRTAPGQLSLSGSRRLKVTDHYHVRVHGGRAGVTPSRHIQVVKSRTRGPRRRRLGVVNVWPVNGSWKPEKWERTIAARREWHGDYLEALRVEVARLTVECDAVTVLGDVNTPEVLDLPGLRLVAKHGLDHIYASRSLRVRRRWLSLPRLGSDHRPVKVRLTWRRK